MTLCLQLPGMRRCRAVLWGSQKWSQKLSDACVTSPSCWRTTIIRVWKLGAFAQLLIWMGRNGRLRWDSYPKGTGIALRRKGWMPRRLEDVCAHRSLMNDADQKFFAKVSKWPAIRGFYQVMLSPFDCRARNGRRGSVLSAYLKSRSPVLCVNVLSVFCECPGGKFYRKVEVAVQGWPFWTIYNKMLHFEWKFLKNHLFKTTWTHIQTLWMTQVLEAV